MAKKNLLRKVITLPKQIKFTSKVKLLLSYHVKLNGEIVVDGFVADVGEESFRTITDVPFRTV
jgi:hypothetical protein